MPEEADSIVPKLQREDILRSDRKHFAEQACAQEEMLSLNKKKEKDIENDSHRIRSQDTRRKRPLSKRSAHQGCRGMCHMLFHPVDIASPNGSTVIDSSPSPSGDMSDLAENENETSRGISPIAQLNSEQR